MLHIVVPSVERWNRKTREFSVSKEQELVLEHSLVSVAKWEARWHKSFFTKDEMSAEEIVDYIRCMTITQNVDPQVYENLTEENIAAVDEYIRDSMTATKISGKGGKKKSGERVTSELIYYWMFSLGIPLECHKWHLNRLLTLIKVFDAKNSPSKKMSEQEILSQNAALNEERRKRLHSKG